MSTDPVSGLLREPQTVEDLDIPQNIVSDILVRLLYTEGSVSLSRMIKVMRVPVVLEGLLAWLRQEHIVEVSQSPATPSPFNLSYKLTGAGMERAREAMERSQYVGPVPVPVHAYSQMLELQNREPRRITVNQMQSALEDLVLPPGFHRHIGPAVNSGTSLFLYGPSGNGKTTIAQKIAGLISGASPIWIPYALTAGGQIIQIHDRLYHRQFTPSPAAPGETRSAPPPIDGRWGLFHRPSVSVGGELKINALDLKFDPVARIYEAPLQMKANGGMFLIDDFGRQEISPAELLNRWVVPLENGVDYLRLHTGQTVVVPFSTLIVFSTNLDPYQLADDAFYRRIQMKVSVSSPNEAQFRQIFEITCRQLGLPFEQDAYDYLVDTWYREGGRAFQAVHPRDLLKIIVALCDYEETPPALTPDRLDEACLTYFVKNEKEKSPQD